MMLMLFYDDCDGNDDSGGDGDDNSKDYGNADENLICPW